jgi:hypothetical protein
MLSGTGSPAVRNEPTGSVVVAIRNGTVALRRRASSRCTKQGGKNPQAPCKTLVNRTYEGVSFGFWTGKWSRLGGPIAQCNSAIRAVLMSQPSWNLPVGVGAHPTWRNTARRRTKVASIELRPVGPTKHRRAAAVR